MEDYYGPVYPNYTVPSYSAPDIGQSMDYSDMYSTPMMATANYDYSMPSMYSAEPDYYSNMFPTTSMALPSGNSSEYAMMYPNLNSYEPMSYMPDQMASSAGEPSFLDRALTEFNKMPIDRQIGLGMSVVGGLGQAMTMKQRNKLAKKAMEQNEKLNAYQAAQMERKMANAAIADRYNNSYDVTAPATVAYRPLTAEQAGSYGEMGAPFQQVQVNPGETTRVQLAQGGMAKYMCGGEVDSKGKPKYEDGGYSGCDIPNYAMGGQVCMPNYGMGGEVYGMPNYASGGQADNIQAMLSEGEFVIPADVVSALGDGNTKAGASALHQMMKGVRERARGGKLDKIPPPAKPAGKYLKKGK